MAFDYNSTLAGVKVTVFDTFGRQTTPGSGRKERGTLREQLVGVVG